jgi:hypothetical protein
VANAKIQREQHYCDSGSWLRKQVSHFHCLGDNVETGVGVKGVPKTLLPEKSWRLNHSLGED